MRTFEPKNQIFPYVAWLICAALFAIYAVPALQPGHNWGDDYGIYLSLARNLFEGRPYAYNVNDNTSPPGFPLLLASWMYLFGTSFKTLKVINVVSWVIVSFATFRITKSIYGAWLAVISSVMLFFLPFYYYLNQDILTDLPSAAFCAVAIMLYFDVVKTENKTIDAIYCIRVFGVFACYLAAILLRPAALPLGIAIILAGLLGAFFDKRNKNIYFGLAAAGAAAFIVNALFFKTASSIHVTVIGSFFSTSNFSLQSFVAFYSGRMWEEFLNFNVLFIWYPINTFYSGIILAGVVIGMIFYFIKTRDFLLPLFMLGYLAMLILAPWNGGPRYLIPLAPVALIFLVSPIAYFADSGVYDSPVSTQNRIFMGIWCGLLVFMVVSALRGISIARNTQQDEISGPKTVEMLNWLRSNTQSADVLCAFKPRAIQFLVDRSTCFLNPDEKGSIMPLLKAQNAKYAVFNLREPKYPPIAAKVASELPEAFRNEDYLILGPVPK